ncbi:MAG: cellulase family glycosylhydrolase [Ignavibacteriaceae bacterium]
MNHIKNIFILFLILASFCVAQKKPASNNDVFVDANGILRWEGTNTEVSLFGLNYTTPFAYSYRVQKKMGLNLKKAIDLDVAQMVRLGLDTFRVHVWDRQISDKEGNILNNDHLNLFDYLLAKLEAHGIKIILTPIAWWGTGWPETDPNEKGFSQFYSKRELITNPKARKVEKNYLTQFVVHINPYTKLSYKDDPSIIAMEIINEPSHPDSGKEVTNYINEMVKAIRDAGYSKPLFYNISQNWNDVQAQAVCNANIQGVSFQWYPTGLVHNKMLHGNYLMNVNHYSVPSDSIKDYNNKAKMVYEFEAADVGRSYMYPAMARSFREAGMQFATMFAYDPSQIAWSNTEYPTHYLNLLYTPSKAISLMIAAKAFHDLPRFKSYGDYPANNKFGYFSVDYNQDLSEMNSDTSFYYSNSTEDIPKNGEALKHVAGCGSSALVQYDGTGAYFLDKITNGIWKLEVYPDCLWLRDPFEPTSMSRQVSRLYWNDRKMIISIPNLGNDFNIYSLSGKKTISSNAVGTGFTIKPGIYLLAAGTAGKDEAKKYLSKREKFLDGLYTPPSPIPPVAVVNKTSKNIFYKTPQNFKFNIASDEKITNADLLIKRLGWRRFERHSLKNVGGFKYITNDSIKILNPGKLEFCVVVNAGGKNYTFPAGINGSPDDWDFFSRKIWTINVLNNDEPIVLFDAGRDRKDLVFPQFSREMRYFVDYKNGSNNETTAISVGVTFSGEAKIPFGMQISPSDIIRPIKNNLANYKYFVIRARSANNNSAYIHFNILTVDGKSYQTKVELKKDWEDIKIPVTSLKIGNYLIMPFSYPQFLKKIWKPDNESKEGLLNPAEINFIQLQCDKADAERNKDKYTSGFEIESITLEAQ